MGSVQEPPASPNEDAVQTSDNKVENNESNNPLPINNVPEINPVENGSSEVACSSSDSNSNCGGDGDGGGSAGGGGDSGEGVAKVENLNVSLPKSENAEITVKKDLKSDNQKSTGIPSISRIARPCAGHQKPAVPTTPTKNNSVLTEDTDSFIIGDRVWVGGTKPGQIAYIGETQFAPGEWAGIVLDQPIGKNDGSVGGIRYFQCESKRGVFSRLTRLTRLPLDGADTSSVFSFTSTPINSGTARRVGSPLSPTGSAKSLRKSPVSLSTSNTSLSSTTHIIDFKVGDRVIVKSSQGSKVGTLRYMGTTNFASGEWCGVELDEPRGKNDGSVEGIRYFECTPQFGLFAPVTKVSKSPLKYKPGNCIIHSGSGLPPSGLKKAGSRESMTSTTTSLASATSGARRDVLKEKQQHIEQLMKERDLERAEITRAANQADEAEQKLAVLRSEYDHYRTESDIKLKEYASVLSKLNTDRVDLLSQLDDEKRKNEDIQFKFEEAAIAKGDIEATNEFNTQRIKELEKQLALERDKVENLEAESGKLFETEEALVKSREDCDILTRDLQQALLKQEIFNEESKKTAKLKEDLENLQKQFDNERLESIKSIEQLKTDISASSLSDQNLKSKLQAEIDDYKSRLQEKEDKCQKQESEIVMLRKELSEVKIALSEKSSAFENKIAEVNKSENVLKVELEKLNIDLNHKIEELKKITSAMKLQEDELKTLKTQLELDQTNLKEKSLEIDKCKENMQNSEIKLKKEIEELKSNFETQIAQKEEQQKALTTVISQKDLKLEDTNKIIEQNLAEIEKLKGSILEIKQSSDNTSSEMNERHMKQIGMKDTQLTSMASEIQQKNEEISKCIIDLTKLKEDINEKNGIIENLHLELDSVKKRLENDRLLISKNNEEINILQLKNGDLHRTIDSTEQNVSQLTQQKKDLESEIQALINSSGDYSVKLQELNDTIAQKDKSIETLRTELTQKLQESQHSEQELKLEIQKVKEERERTKFDYEEKLKISCESENLLRQRCEQTSSDLSKTRDELTQKVTELQGLLNKKDLDIKMSSDNYTEKERVLKERLENISSEYQKTIQELESKVRDLTSSSENDSSKIKELTDTIIQKEKFIETIQTEMTQKLQDSQSSKQELQLKLKNAIDEAESCKLEFEEKLKSKSEAENILLQKCQLATTDSTKVREEFELKISELQNLLDKKDLEIKKTSEESIKNEHCLKEQLQKVTTELQNINQSTQEKINLLTSENIESQKIITQKSELITKLEEKLKNHITESEEKAIEIHKTSDEAIKKIESQLTEKDAKVLQLISEIQLLKHNSNTQNIDIGTKDHQIMELSTELETTRNLINQLRNENSQLQKMQIQTTNEFATSKQQYTDLLSQVAGLTSKIESADKLTQDLQLEKNIYVQLLQKLQITEKQKQNLITHLEGVANKNDETSKYQSLLESVKNLKATIFDEDSKKIAELQKILDATRQKMDLNIIELQGRKVEISKLQDELKQTKQQQSTPAQGHQNSLQMNNNSMCDDRQQLLEAKQFAENQVQFLNSIIVDMQRKNEEQKARIEILESGYSASAADELQLYKLQPKAVAPRVYCDICEEFDKHETEDCPLQASEDAPASHCPPIRKSTFTVTSDRPYCEICEVFGHFTEECNEDQTF